MEQDENFDGKPDAEALRKAMKGLGTDEDTIIKIIANRTNIQRQKIKEEYKNLFQRDIIKDLKHDLSGHFEDVAIALFYSPEDYDCLQLRKAMKGLGTNEDTLIEILATRPPNVIEEIKKRYPIVCEGRDLIKDIKSETSGCFRDILLSLLEANRPMNEYPDVQECEKCARALYEAGEKIKGTDVKVFTEIFTKKSPAEFVCIAQLYYKITGHTILQAIENEFKGDSKECLVAITYAILSPSEYFAKKVNKAIKGLGTKDTMLIRILVTRDEIDMPEIKQFYKQTFKKDMLEDIKSDTSGDYKKILIELASH